jgi:hypothetical protein
MVVVPEVDVWLAAFSRQRPDPGVVRRVGQLIEERRVFLSGPIRQALMVQVRSGRDYHRLLTALAPFPDLPTASVDYVTAADLTRKLATMGVLIAPSQALLWVQCERLGVLIWSRDGAWRALQRHGAPLLPAGA